MKKIVEHLGFICVLLIASVHMYAQCDAPFPGQADGISQTSATIHWLDLNDPESDQIHLDIYPVYESPDGIPDTFYVGANGEARIENLSEATQYRYKIRSVCGSDTSEWSQTRTFKTHFSIEPPCPLYLPLRDDNCNSSADQFLIEVNEFPNKILGQDIFLYSVSLAIEHTWPADLKLELISPSGTIVNLSSHNGFGQHNYGRVQGSFCNEPAIFIDGACEKIDETSEALHGYFKPQESFELINSNGGTANGLWTLRICDRASDDIGLLKSFKMEFVTMDCPTAVPPGVLSLSDTSAVIHFSPDLINCSQRIVELYSYSALLDSVILYWRDTVACGLDSLLVEGLLPATEYTVTTYFDCNSITRSAPSCPVQLTTFCAPVIQSFSFDTEQDCLTECNANCVLNNGVWFNSQQDDGDWLVHEGSTPTPNTGPSFAFNDSGKYLYYESSGPDCQGNTRSTLTSICLSVLPQDGRCHLSFRSYLFGEDINGISLEISDDGGENWETIYTLSGNQGADWKQNDIDLFEYENRSVQLRIAAHGASGARGDIGLDEIVFYGVVPIPADDLIYYRDMDGDGYGNPVSPFQFCTSGTPDGYSLIAGDCNDQDPGIHPDTIEIHCNLIDENCNGMSDDPDPLNPIIYDLMELEDETCPGAGDGKIVLSVSGGNPPYTFDWGSGIGDSIIIGLTAGFYQCTISDSEGCLTFAGKFEISALNSMEFILDKQINPQCENYSNGSLDLLIGGGNPPYNFEWNTGDTTLDIDMLPAGEYQLTVVDQQGCKFKSPVYTLIPEQGFSVFSSTNDVSCRSGSDGVIFLQTVGGNPPFEIKWNNNDTGLVITNLEASNYQATITDASGCIQQTDTINISQPEILSYNVSVLDPPSCNGSQDGQIQINVLGGTPPYAVFWNDGQQTIISNDLLQVDGGYYDLSITDFNFCNFSDDSLFLPQPSELVIKLDSIKEASCSLSDDGSIAVIVEGGIGPYKYLWSTGKDTLPSIHNISEGQYQISVTDASGCSVLSEVFQVPSGGDQLEASFSILDSISCFNTFDASLGVTISNGTSPFRFFWSTGLNHVLHATGDTLADLIGGEYSVTITDASGCGVIAGPINIHQPGPIILENIERHLPACAGDSTGSIELTVTGGTEPYNITWSDGGIGLNRDRLPSGSYDISIEDKNACFLARNNILLPQVDSFYFDFFTSPENGDASNGTISISPSGGMLPYSIAWDDGYGGPFDFERAGLATGHYKFTLEDNLGCLLIDSIFVDQINSTTNEIREESINLYPNPFENGFYIEYSDPKLTAEVVHIEVFDLTGNLIKKTNNTQPSSKLYFSFSAPPGMYILKMIFGNGQYSYRKIVQK